MSKNIPYKTYLEPHEIPKQWYNIHADMPNKLAPPLHPATMQPVTFEDMTGIFAPELVMQEMTPERYVDIPETVQEMYQQYRPSPLTRAYALEKALGTPARIYYKYEGNNPSGSHKLNSAIPQVYYNKMAGIKKITTETGAGQWGTALSIACQLFDIECDVYMVKVSANQKPYRKLMMQTYGANVIASPSNLTNAGRAVLEKNPDSPGSLGIAISEALEVAMSSKDINYCLGSVLNHVVLHQTVIGQEAMLQMQKIGEKPDVVIGCNGGGSNLGGLAFPFLGKELRDGKKNTRYIAVEPSACPKLTKGVLAYDFGDNAGLAPAVYMYTLGHGFVPSGIHAGGLRYHGDSPLLSMLYRDKFVEAVAVDQLKVFEAAVQFAKYEIILPAPESAHAVCVAIDEALKCKETGEEKVILFNLSGNGYFDLAAYESYLNGHIVDAPFTDEELKAGLATLPKA